MARAAPASGERESEGSECWSVEPGAARGSMSGAGAVDTRGCGPVWSRSSRSGWRTRAASDPTTQPDVGASELKRSYSMYSN